VREPQQSHYRLLLQVREEERKRVAFELHDRIIQAIIGLKYYLSNLRAHAHSQTMTDELIGQAQAALRAILDDMHNLSADHHSSPVKASEFAKAIQSYVQHIRNTSRLHISLHFDGNPDQLLTEEIAEGLLRVVQETCVNIQKHAAARQVVIQVFVRPDEIIVAIDDDGVGFQVPTQMEQLFAAQHFGLLGMQERMKLLHGRLQVVSTPGRGTSVYASVACPRPAEATIGRAQRADGSQGISQSGIAQQAHAMHNSKIEEAA
jgi:signal transduction histidine kinase